VPAPRRLHHGLKAERPNHVWALDYQHDATEDGRELKFLNVVDEFTREALAIEVDRSIDAEETVAVLKRLAAERGAPANLRADNGPELTAAVLREWCRLGKTDTAYIEPGSPWQNPYVESFNARMRDELLNVEVFTCLEEARVLAADWRTDYNANHPHSALGMMSPERFAASLRSPSGLAARGGDQERYSTQTNPGLSHGVGR
jgi:putative transposase